MPVAWDASLPQFFAADRHHRRRPQNVVRTQTLSGRMRSRLKGHNRQELWDVSWVMTQTQLVTFETFYVTTLAEGSVVFQGLLHPQGIAPPGGSGANRVWQFFTDPEDDLWHGSPVNYLVTAQLVLLPDLPT